MRKLRFMVELRRLRALRELADRGTIAAAAEARHLTPSAVSQQLTALDAEVAGAADPARALLAAVAGSHAVARPVAEAADTQLLAGASRR